MVLTQRMGQVYGVSYYHNTVSIPLWFLRNQVDELTESEIKTALFPYHYGSYATIRFLVDSDEALLKVSIPLWFLRNHKNLRSF